MEATIYRDEEVSGGSTGAITPVGLLVVFLLVIVLLSDQMLNSTLEEKENRVTEMILTTVNLTTLVVSKIAAVFAVGAIQILVFLTPVAIGAIMLTAKDAGVIFGPLILAMTIPFYAISLIISEPESLFVQVFTHFPLTAPVTAMLCNGLSTLGPLAAGIVIAELFVLGILVLRVAVQLFRYGSIAYIDKLDPRTVLGHRRPVAAGK